MIWLEWASHCSVCFVVSQILEFSLFVISSIFSSGRGTREARGSHGNEAGGHRMLFFHSPFLCSIIHTERNFIRRKLTVGPFISSSSRISPAIFLNLPFLLERSRRPWLSNDAEKLLMYSDISFGPLMMYGPNAKKSPRVPIPVQQEHGPGWASIIPPPPPPLPLPPQRIRENVWDVYFVSPTDPINQWNKMGNWNFSSKMSRRAGRCTSLPISLPVDSCWLLAGEFKLKASTMFQEVRYGTVSDSICPVSEENKKSAPNVFQPLDLFMWSQISTRWR